MTDAAAWFADHTVGAPPSLQARAAEYLAMTEVNEPVASRLADAAAIALRMVTGQGRSRATALDLLTADSLLTLALLAQAELAPADLDRLAADIVGAAAA